MVLRRKRAVQILVAREDGDEAARGWGVIGGEDGGEVDITRGGRFDEREAGGREKDEYVCRAHIRDDSRFASFGIDGVESDLAARAEVGALEFEPTTVPRRLSSLAELASDAMGAEQAGEGIVGRLGVGHTAEDHEGNGDGEISHC